MQEGFDLDSLSSSCLLVFHAGIVLGKMLLMPIVGFFSALFFKTFVWDIPDGTFRSQREIRFYHEDDRTWDLTVTVLLCCYNSRLPLLLRLICFCYRYQWFFLLGHHGCIPYAYG